MTVLVAGRSGQVARALLNQAKLAEVALVAIGRPELDLTDEASIERILERVAPSVIINAAAYTAVDRAEEEPDEAWRINADAAGVLARAAYNYGAPIVHLSTDYVFSGAQDAPYREEDDTGPMNTYGESKLEGERLVLQANPRSIVVRTAWVFDGHGANFVRKMLRLACANEEISVVSDQVGSPTYAEDLARALLSIALAPKYTGIYHCVGGGETTWFGFAHAIFTQALARGGPSASVKPVQSEGYPTRVRRPANSRLNCDKIAADYGVQLRPWDAALSECLDHIAAGGWRVD